MKPRVTAQLRSSSGRSSKLLRDHTQIETVVEVEGVDRLVLDVNSGGGTHCGRTPRATEIRAETYSQLAWCMLTRS